MNNNGEIKLIGLLMIFQQFFCLLGVINLKILTKKHKVDYCYKRFTTKTQLITMLFVILPRYDSLREICEHVRSVGKVESFRLTSSPDWNTAYDRLRNRCDSLFEDIYSSLESITKVFCRNAGLLN